MLIKNVDFIKLKEEWKTNQEVNTKWKGALPPDFLESLLPVFAKVPLKYNSNNKVSMKTTMQTVPQEGIETEKGWLVKPQLQAAVLFVYENPRYKLLVKPMGKEPRLGTATPIFMYAHKLYNNISYEDWDKTDPHIKYALGNRLEKILGYEEESDWSDIEGLRKYGLTYGSGKNAGKMAELTSNKMNLSMVGYKKVPELICQMRLQTWIFNSSIRNTEAMILDPIKWNLVPKAIDAVSIKAQKVEKKTDEDNLWC